MKLTIDRNETQFSKGGIAEILNPTEEVLPLVNKKVNYLGLEARIVRSNKDGKFWLSVQQPTDISVAIID